MSVCTFIAANVEMPEIKNPHYKMLSINEAVEMGIKVREELLKDVDRDKPDVILWSDIDAEFDGDLPDDFALIKMENTHEYCDKPFGVYVEWDNWSKERAERIVGYIKKVLEITNEVEIWRVWLTDYGYTDFVTETINISDLTSDHIKDIDDKTPWTIKDGKDFQTHYCLKIVK